MLAPFDINLSFKRERLAELLRLALPLSLPSAYSSDFGLQRHALWHGHVAGGSAQLAALKAVVTPVRA